MNRDYIQFQKTVGYEFKDRGLLIHALTHTSYANELHEGREGSNERLEFLGDAVLELVSTEFFFNRYPELDEGELTKIRASYVCEPALYEMAERLPLSEYILLGKGEESSGGRNRSSLISDAFEAVIGAVYLDGGFYAAKDFILRNVLSSVGDDKFFFDNKTTLQEEVQKRYNCEPVYNLVEESGPDHNKLFTVEVSVNGKVFGEGTASSKKHAAQNAAHEALKKIGKA